MEILVETIMVKSLIPVDNPEDHIHQGSGRKASLQLGFMMANDGKTLIPAYKNLSDDKGYDTNCHGITFAEGKYWVNNNIVEGLLSAEGYKKKGNNDLKAKEGYIVVFEDKDGKGVHSETVMSSENGNVIVEGLGGMQISTSQKNVNAAWPSYTEKVYYEKPKKDLQMNDKDIELMKKFLEEQ